MWCIGILTFLAVSVNTLHAQDAASARKLRIAVMNFESNNCPPEFGRAFSEMVMGRLFENELFTLLERNNIDFLGRHRGPRGAKKLDDGEALRVGRMLSVDKVTLGSVSRFGDFNIEVRIVDVKSGTVDIRVPAKVEDEEDFDDTARFIAGRIDFHYHGVSPITEFFDVAVTAVYLQPLGDLARGASPGFGSHLHVYGNKLLYGIAGRNARTMFLTGYYQLGSNFNSLRSLRMAPLGAFAGYRCALSGNVDLLPYAGGGYIITRADYDTIETRTYGVPEFRDRFYFNPYISVRAEFNLRLGYRLYLMFTPFYTIFFEPDRLGQLAAGDAGLKMLF